MASTVIVPAFVRLLAEGQHYALLSTVTSAAGVPACPRGGATVAAPRNPDEKFAI